MSDFENLGALAADAELEACRPGLSFEDSCHCRNIAAYYRGRQQANQALYAPPERKVLQVEIPPRYNPAFYAVVAIAAGVAVLLLML